MTQSNDLYHFYYPWRVRYSEVDPQEIVFNSRYLEIADAAGTEYFRALGFPPLELLPVHHLDMVVVRAEVDYVAPARLDDLLHIYVRTAAIGRSSFTMEFEVRNERGDKLLNRVTIKYVNIDRATGKSAPVPEIFRNAVAAFEKQAVAL